MTGIAPPLRPALPIAPRSIAVGSLGSVALLLLYLGTISLAQGVTHAVEQLAIDVPFVAIAAVGFGTQIGLLAELRTVGLRHRESAAVVAAGTGTSAAAMLACCAHHVVDLLPIVGVSAAAVFLNSYRTPLFLVGIAINVFGVAVIVRQLERAQRACPSANSPSSSLSV